MCDGDLTPVTVRPVVGNNESGTLLLFLGETERLHTCRNFSTIREWVNKRGEMGSFGKREVLVFGPHNIPTFFDCDHMSPRFVMPLKHRSNHI